MKLILATNNVKKVTEIRQILGGSFEVIGLGEASIDVEMIEDCQTFSGNAIRKALAVAKATGVYPATFRERVVPAEKPTNPLFLFCAPGRSPGRPGDVRWSGGLSRRPNGSRTARPPSRWRVPQTANPGGLPCQGPPYLAVARQRPQTDIDISNTMVPTELAIS